MNHKEALIDEEAFKRGVILGLHEFKRAINSAMDEAESEQISRSALNISIDRMIGAQK